MSSPRSRALSENLAVGSLGGAYVGSIGATRPRRSCSEPLLSAESSPAHPQSLWKTEIRGGNITFKIGKRSAWKLERDATSNGFRLMRQKSIGGMRHQHKLDIHRIHHIAQLYSLYIQDMFHSLVNLRLRLLIAFCAVAYLMAFSVLAICFWMINDTCDLGMESPMEAFVFGVETWLTIGYGVAEIRGPYFRDCWSAVVIVTLQGIVGLILNAFLVGLVITRINSGTKRGCSLAFSNKAVIREVGGRLYLMVQVCEMRQTQLLEAHVRVYVIRNPDTSAEMPLDAPQAFEMRLSRPDDDLGSLILPVLPTVIVHEIDSFSPLGPSKRSDDPLQSWHWTRPAKRAVDAACGERSALWCRTCGEQFPAQEMLDAHMEYLAEQDRLNGATDRPHQKPQTRPSTPSCEYPDPCSESWREQVSSFLACEWFEIICLLEGVDTTTAATVQACHSYTMEDIVWDHTFSPMFSVDPEKRSAVIDFTKINDLVRAPPER